MMKFVTPETAAQSLRHGEQYDNCSELLIESDITSLEELDPAILSCGLPAIMLNEEDPATMTTATAAVAVAVAQLALPSSLMPLIRYSVAHLLSLRKSPLAHRRPAAIDDPRTAQFPIWCRAGFHPQHDRARRISGGDEELLHHGASGRKPNDRQRDHGYNPPRFRRNHEFSNRNHHVIVKSYSAGDGPMRLQDTIIEEEPEWVAAGPTSRLDTIELRGFDDDMARTVADSLKASPSGKQRNGAFFDELLHYEHVHPKHGAGKHDTSGTGGDGESVSTSNTGSPPPARSTPTKSGPDASHNGHGHGAHGRKGPSGAPSGCSSSGAGVNVSNFEELMKFDSILGDSGDSNSSRFSKYYRRGSSGGAGYGQHPAGSHSHAPHQQHHVRFALDRNTHHYNGAQPQHRQAGSGRLPLSALQHPPAGVDTSFPGAASQAATSSGPASSSTDVKSFQRLLEVMAAQNQRMQQQQQQQYLLQLLQNCQQTETLRQMLMKKCSLETAAAAAAAISSAGSGGPSQQQRVPTQAELQLHTQTIMKQALLRKKIAEQSRLILEQQGGTEPIPAVQQLIQSICPNVQRSLSVLGGGGPSSFGTEGRNGSSSGGALYVGGNRGQSRSSSNRRY